MKHMRVKEGSQALMFVVALLIDNRIKVKQSATRDM